MGINRLSLVDEGAAPSQATPVGAFMALPAMLVGVMDAATYQRQLYQWAYEQARHTVEARRPSPIRDLFAIMN
jgi:hypothetical protein